jgi:hypothetical protein
MPSPDFSQYVDLTIYDKQPSEIYDAAITYARTALPEWTPAVGSIESAVLQAAAQMTGELAAAINRLPNGILEGLLQLLGVYRNAGTRATGVIDVTSIDDLGYTLEAGTLFGYIDSSDPDNPILYPFTTDETLYIPQGSTSASVAITGSAAVLYPELPAATALETLSQISFIDTVILNATLSAGADPETDAEYLARATAKLQSYNQALVLPAQYEAHVLSEYSSVYRCKAYSRVNPSSDSLSDSLANGYLTVYVCGLNGASLSSGVRTEIDDDLTDRSVAGLTITIKNAPVVNVTVAVTVVRDSGFLASEVQSNVEDALSAYLHPDYWDWSSTIYYNELISLIDQVSGVKRVSALTLTDPSSGTDFTASGSNLEFKKYGALPRVTTTVTVV